MGYVYPFLGSGFANWCRAGPMCKMTTLGGIQTYCSIIWQLSQLINIIISSCGKNLQVWPDTFPNFLEEVGLVSNSQYSELNR